MARRILIATALLVVLFPQPSQAYLDPTSGSLLLQLLLGGIAGAAVVLKLFWHRIRGWFGAGNRDHDDPAP